MNLKEELMADLKDAMKSKEQIKKDTIIMLKAAILQKEKDDRKELSQDELMEIVFKEVKKRKESIPEFEKGNRLDIVETIKEEIGFLEKYMPKQLSEKEVEEIIIKAIKETDSVSMKDMGKVMQAIKPFTVGKADGKMISDIVKLKLS